MSDKTARARKMVLFGVILLVLFVGLALLIKYLVTPKLEEVAAENAEAAKEELIKKTSDGREYANVVKIGGDDFLGYATLRSDEIQFEMDRYDTRLYFVDDGGDCLARQKALASGALDMAVFTIDTSITTGAELGDFPGVQVGVHDKSNGVDAVVVFKSTIPNVEALNKSGAKIVAQRNTISETLGRHLVANGLPNIRNEDWLIATGSQQETLDMLRNANPQELRAFVFYEPYLSIALKIPGMHVVYNTSMISGTIVDGIFARRQFLVDHPDQVQHVLESNFTVVYNKSAIEGGMIDLIMKDAQKSGTSLTPEQAGWVVKGTLWANTLENYAMFGLLSREQSQGIPHIRSTIDQIVRFLVKTGKLQSNPVEGKEEILYTSNVLANMQRAGFRPNTQGHESVRGRKELAALTDEQWSQLIYRMDLDAVEITFRPSNSNLTGTANRLLGEVQTDLETYHDFYVEVTGRAMAGGNPEANKALALARAEAVIGGLITKGANPNRFKKRINPQANHGQGRSVTFRLMQKPY